MTDTTSAVPNPGSDEAVARGCTCRPLLNARGFDDAMANPTVSLAGQIYTFWMSGDCPVHNPKPQTAKDKTDD